MRRVVEELTAHVGGAPTATESALIARAAWLSLRLYQLNGKIAVGADFSEHDAKTYLAWSNSLARAMLMLGRKAATPPPHIPIPAYLRGRR